MAIKPVIRMGNPLLKEISKPVKEFDSASLWSLIEDMKDTMLAQDGAGLAAIQIAVPLRVVIFSVESNPRYPDAESVPETVLINPTITPVGQDKESGWEGCLSVPGLRGLVERDSSIRYQGFDPRGNPIDRTVSDFHARVVQHEVDHLDGILYVQRMEDMQSLGFLEELDDSGAMNTGCQPCESE